MLARHPLTGKDIRIISLDTSIHKESKTLCWFDETCVPGSAERWSRWDIGASTVSTAKQMAAVGLQPDVVLCINPYSETAAWCESAAVRTVRIVAVPRTFIEFIGLENLMKLRMDNLICLDEIHDMYPFVGGKWDGSVGDAQVLLSMILHANVMIPTTKLTSQRNLRTLRIDNNRKAPQPLWFITQYYTPEKGARRSEIRQCLEKNIASPFIDSIVLLNEKACAPSDPKIQEHIVGKRLTYADVIRWIYEKVPENTLVAFANADIFLDGESWRSLWSADLETQAKFLALLRWDVESSEPASIAAAKLFGPRADSQDTWVVSSNSVKAVTWDWAELNFPFGKGGCDNSITIEMFKKRFLVANPAMTLRTYHLHTSGVRGYNPADIVDKPVYLHIKPSGLHDKKPVFALSNTIKPRTFTFKPFERRIKGPLTPSQARTFCTMVGRSTQGVVTLEIDGANLWTPPPISLYELTDVFQTRDGLVYTHESILVGPTKAGAMAWDKSHVSYLSAAISVEEALITPLPDSVANVPSRFILDYMAKIFLLRREFGMTKGEFWCSKDEECINAIKAFSWPAQEIPVLSRDENQQSWCKKGVMWPHADTPEGFISQEEIEALRGAFGLGGWKEDSDTRLVIIVDAKWITEDMATSIEDKLQESGLSVKLIWSGRTSLDAALRSIRGAWGLILFDKSLAQWAWVLPEGARVWDIQSEMEPTASLLHLSCAAALEHRLVIVPKGSNDVEKAMLVDKLVGSIIKERGPSIVTQPSVNVRPKLFMPTGHTGFYAHAGDSFRETARVWAKRGYVDCIPSSSHQVWLNEIGDTLLYDRPTYQWLEQAPPKERTWRRALFGNPAPPSSKSVSSWSFWPRRPELVEAAVDQGLPKRSWESRSQSVVFYGRSENAVQKSRRTTAEWSKACSEFFHMDGTQKYPFPAEVYLERLAESKYGLCLAGYGYKCHREIECMAMGTVPIVASEVDMEHYAEPPKEGLHYFRVKSPEEVGPLLLTITAERWVVMSNACRDWWSRNASVDGLWELTKRLATSPHLDHVGQLAEGHSGDEFR